jgi:hypothetical protein
MLAWDTLGLERDAKGKPITRWDGETMKESPVTGEMVPDDMARVTLTTYVNPRKAKWPKADFIVGNPPFIGSKRIHAALGDGYAKALRTAHTDVPDSADLVMFWWNQAADIVKSGHAAQAGLITTNSITSAFNRRVLARHLLDPQRCWIAFAVPDHPWTNATGSAAVRIAMTVLRAGSWNGRLDTVQSENLGSGPDGAQHLSFTTRTGTINDDLTVATATSSLVGLRAQGQLSSMGVQLYGNGFILDPKHSLSTTTINPHTGYPVVRLFINGRDVAATPRKAFVIDFFGTTETEARDLDPTAFQHLIDHVKPERDENRREPIRRIWWRFGWERPVWRAAAGGLRRYIATCRTAKHRVFVLVPIEVIAESKLVVIASDDAFVLGCCSSRIHVVFAERTGAWLGVGNDSTYNHADCFNKFPFAACSESRKVIIRKRRRIPRRTQETPAGRAPRSHHSARSAGFALTSKTRAARRSRRSPR